jgi:hypothetical protein
MCQYQILYLFLGVQIANEVPCNKECWSPMRSFGRVETDAPVAILTLR